MKLWEEKAHSLNQPLALPGSAKDWLPKLCEALTVDEMKTEIISGGTRSPDQRNSGPLAERTSSCGQEPNSDELEQKNRMSGAASRFQINSLIHKT